MFTATLASGLLSSSWILAEASDGGEKVLKIVIMFLTVLQMLMGLPGAS